MKFMKTVIPILLFLSLVAVVQGTDDVNADVASAGWTK